jgi:hypothetical protein
MKNVKRSLASTLAFLLLTAISVLAQTPRLTFGPLDDSGSKKGSAFDDRSVLNRDRGLRVVAPDLGNRGINLLRDAETLKQTGGGMLVSVAEPHPDLANQRMLMAYIPSRKDGSRFEVTIGQHKAYMDLFDWEAEPLVNFVDSGHNGAINISLGSNTDTVLLDESFQERLLGLRFIQADLLPRGKIASQKYLPRGANQLFILGNGEKQWLGSVTSVLEAEEAVRELLEMVNTRYSVLTDAGEPFVFSLIGDRFVISGTPYYFFWNPRNNQVEPNESLNEEFRRSWPLLKRMNPVVIRAVERAFRTTAFFRYQQKKNPINWSALVQDVKSISLPSVPTPRVLQSARSE